MSNTVSMPRGFKCECGTWHEFGAYVAAHWDMSLTHTCPDCGRKHEVIQGSARLTHTPRRHRK